MDSGKSIEIQGIKTWLQRLGRMPDKVDKALLRQVQDEVRPMVGHMRNAAAAYGDMPAKAASTVRLGSMKNGATVHVGGTGSVASTILYGAEFGGRLRPKRAVARRSKKGKIYVMRRRTTMQFLPHLGNRGYWFWPTVRKDLKGVNRRVREVVRKAVNDG